MRILFLPFLSIPSGHHHAADSLKAEIEALDIPCNYKKIDILAYSYGNIERLTSAIYLHWIQRLPQVYSSLYYLFTVRKRTVEKRHYIYEWLFLRKMKRLIRDTKPDIVICTHALPSYLIAHLKKKNEWTGIAVNVYTDYFINRLWGKAEIDYHFVPSPCMETELQGVRSRQIVAAGIPVHPLLRVEKKERKKTDRYSVLISGGNMGTGSIRRLLERIRPSGIITYKVLCGKNEKLYRQVLRMNNPFMKAIPFISDKDSMNRLYEKADAIITKPGGITVTECLLKKIPIIIYEALPGQEEMNLRFLKEKQLIADLQRWRRFKNIEPEIVKMLNESASLKQRAEAFRLSTDQKKIVAAIKEMAVRVNVNGKR